MADTPSLGSPAATASDNPGQAAAAAAEHELRAADLMLRNITIGPDASHRVWESHAYGEALLPEPTPTQQFFARAEHYLEAAPVSQAQQQEKPQQSGTGSTLDDDDDMPIEARAASIQLRLNSARHQIFNMVTLIEAVLSGAQVKLELQEQPDPRPLAADPGGDDFLLLADRLFSEIAARGTNSASASTTSTASSAAVSSAATTSSLASPSIESKSSGVMGGVGSPTEEKLPTAAALLNQLTSAVDEDDLSPLGFDGAADTSTDDPAAVGSRRWCEAQTRDPRSAYNRRRLVVFGEIVGSKRQQHLQAAATLRATAGRMRQAITRSRRFVRDLSSVSRVFRVLPLFAAPSSVAAGGVRGAAGMGAGGAASQAAVALGLAGLPLFYVHPRHAKAATQASVVSGGVLGQHGMLADARLAGLWSSVGGGLGGDALPAASPASAEAGTVLPAAELHRRLAALSGEFVAALDVSSLSPAGELISGAGSDSAKSGGGGGGTGGGQAEQYSSSRLFPVTADPRTGALRLQEHTRTGIRLWHNCQPSLRLLHASQEAQLQRLVAHQLLSEAVLAALRAGELSANRTGAGTSSSASSPASAPSGTSSAVASSSAAMSQFSASSTSLSGAGSTAGDTSQSGLGRPGLASSFGAGGRHHSSAVAAAAVSSGSSGVAAGGISGVGLGGVGGGSLAPEALLGAGGGASGDDASASSAAWEVDFLRLPETEMGDAAASPAGFAPVLRVTQPGAPPVDLVWPGGRLDAGFRVRTHLPGSGQHQERAQEQNRQEQADHDARWIELALTSRVLARQREFAPSRLPHLDLLAGMLPEALALPGAGASGSAFGGGGGTGVGGGGVGPGGSEDANTKSMRADTDGVLASAAAHEAAGACVPEALVDAWKRRQTGAGGGTRFLEWTVASVNHLRRCRQLRFALAELGARHPHWELAVNSARTSALANGDRAEAPSEFLLRVRGAWAYQIEVPWLASALTITCAPTGQRTGCADVDTVIRALERLIGGPGPGLARSVRC